MSNRIRDLIISMVKEEIETNPQFENYRDGLEFQYIGYPCYGVVFNVHFRFKPKGRGRKDNRIRFDVSLDRSMNESIRFVYTTFEPKETLNKVSNNRKGL